MERVKMQKEEEKEELTESLVRKGKKDQEMRKSDGERAAMREGEKRAVITLRIIPFLQPGLFYL